MEGIGPDEVVAAIAQQLEHVARPQAAGQI
jgi:hypothetical protein